MNNNTDNEPTGSNDRATNNIGVSPEEREVFDRVASRLKKVVERSPEVALLGSRAPGLVRKYKAGTIDAYSVYTDVCSDLSLTPVDQESFSVDPKTPVFALLSQAIHIFLVSGEFVGSDAEADSLAAEICDVIMLQIASGRSQSPLDLLSNVVTELIRRKIVPSTTATVVLNLIGGFFAS